MKFGSWISKEEKDGVSLYWLLKSCSAPKAETIDITGNTGAGARNSVDLGLAWARFQLLR